MYLMNEGKFVNSIYDLEGIVSDDVFKVIEDNDTNQELRIEDLKQELDCYTDMNCNARRGISDTKRNINNLIENINDSKRLNRKMIIESLNELIDELNNLEV